jgi:hypothetical protein
LGYRCPDVAGYCASSKRFRKVPPCPKPS